MSWHDQRGRHGLMTRRLRLLFAFLPALLLAGCIHPLYGTVGEGGQVAEELKAIEIAPISGRLGHYLGDELIFALNGTGSHVPAKYKLVVTPAEGVQTPLVDTVTGLVTAATVTVSAHYVLTPVDGGPPIAKGTAFVAASYDRTSQRFSDMRAARDSEQRDARQLADQIHTLLATALAKQT
ncbi:MAG: LPS assembly lipoprotein LptE [Methylovirgula sp.]